MNLIFDLDGTLINSLPGIAQSLNRSLEQYHLPTHSVEGIREFIGSGSRTLCQRAAGSPDKATIDLLESAFMSHYQELWKSGTEIYSGITDLLIMNSASSLTNRMLSPLRSSIHSSPQSPSAPF